MTAASCSSRSGEGRGPSRRGRSARRAPRTARGEVARGKTGLACSRTRRRVPGRRACRGSSRAAGRTSGRGRRGSTPARAPSGSRRVSFPWGRRRAPARSGGIAVADPVRPLEHGEEERPRPFPLVLRLHAPRGSTARGGRSSRCPRPRGTARPGSARRPRGTRAPRPRPGASRPASTLATRKPWARSAVVLRAPLPVLPAPAVGGAGARAWAEAPRRPCRTSGCGRRGRARRSSSPRSRRDARARPRGKHPREERWPGRARSGRGRDRPSHVPASLIVPPCPRKGYTR